MARSKAVEIGARYTRADGSSGIYVVTAVVEKPGHLPHARLVLDDGTPGPAKSFWSVLPP